MELNELREKINYIDEQITELFKQRMDVSLEIAKYKKEKGLPVLDKSRERQLLARVSSLAGEDYERYVRKLYVKIMELSRARQQEYMAKKNEAIKKLILQAVESTDKLFPTRAEVACQGTEGSYSSLACERMFKYPSIHFCKTFEDVFISLENGECRYGILPIENSTAGSVNRVYDLLSKYKCFIVRSTRLKISHALLGNSGTELSEIKEIYSHWQAIAQCSEFLKTLSPDVKIIECENTAIASKMVAESGRKDMAAISSMDCAELYGLECVASGIENNDNNYTRFICISKTLEIYPGSERTSFTLVVPHRPGSLYDVMAKFSLYDINIRKLESRPLPGTDFEFLFYFDIDASVHSDSFFPLVDELSTEALHFNYLGSYNEIV